MKKIGLYWHTIKYLKPSQIINRITRSLPKRKPTINSVPLLRPMQGQWRNPVKNQSSLLSSHEFLFLGLRGSLKELGWDGKGREKLWRYNQHYFDDLNADDSPPRDHWHKELVDDWIKNNPPCRGTGWEPYPISRRIVNWIKWTLSGKAPSDTMLQSLFCQTSHLSKTIEWHLLANHLFANAKALVFAGIFFEGEVAQEWGEKGLSILQHELEEQILADGGHFERSPMYHAIILEDILDIINLLHAYNKHSDLLQHCCQVATKMLRWLEIMTHPDKQVAFFNDASFGIAPTLDQLWDYAERLDIASEPLPIAPFGLVHLEQSGYIRITAGKVCILLDVAEIGPNYQPGHSHADTLSFECSYAGERVLVNGGTSCYGTSPQRLRERQTASHNTVEIDGESSSQVWSAFRLAKRAKPTALYVEQNKETITVQCSHTGYSWLRGKPQHSRKWTIEPRRILIEDSITSNCQALARFRFHPDVEIEALYDQGAQLLTSSGVELSLMVKGSQWKISDSHYAPEFGLVRPSKTLELMFLEKNAMHEASFELWW